MSIKPILFNTEMVRAILDGRKTVTRRVIKPQPEMHMFGDREALAWIPPAIIKGYLAVGVKYTEYLKKPYRPGDVLWVRETFRVDYLSNIVGSGRVHYKADGSLGDLHFQPARYDMMRRAQLKPGWRPNENMPREAARIWLRVTDMRVERLQEIDVDGIRAEGLTSACVHVGDMEIAMQEFALLWDSTIKPADRKRYGWAANPFCWVIEFEKCKKPEEG